jgi:hypothetical protein
MKLQRIPHKEAREKALPIFLSGFEKRSRLRSAAEDALRSPQKVARDRRASAKPHISTI